MVLREAKFSHAVAYDRQAGHSRQQVNRTENYTQGMGGKHHITQSQGGIGHGIAIVLLMRDDHIHGGPIVEIRLFIPGFLGETENIGMRFGYQESKATPTVSIRLSAERFLRLESL